MGTVTIDTRPYGPLTVDERQILTFVNGLFGFEHLTRYALLDSHQPPFYWLQSLEDPQVAFVVIDPRVFRPDYDPAPLPSDLEALGLERQEDLLIFAIVTIPENQREMTANLQGPLLVNRKTRRAAQVISTDDRWHVKHRILEELAALRKR
ncbi:flagellar assembly protein FliW [Spirochaeta thermophila]|uniref:flagellar assembly protein FliW n=1 Tax=Winmispira thermophila TaxID=154 RepID=UPI0011D15AA0|nr:flagellar assembly protein FliW [Spirochaeta thermophila]